MFQSTGLFVLAFFETRWCILDAVVLRRVALSGLPFSSRLHVAWQCTVKCSLLSLQHV